MQYKFLLSVIITVIDLTARSRAHVVPDNRAQVQRHTTYVDRKSSSSEIPSLRGSCNGIDPPPWKLLLISAAGSGAMVAVRACLEPPKHN